MITSTPPADPPRRLHASATAPAGGFTLAEVLIASALSAFVLAGVLSAFVFLSRSGFRISGYGELDAEVRRGLAAFARDTRNATDTFWSPDSRSIAFHADGRLWTVSIDGGFRRFIAHVPSSMVMGGSSLRLAAA